jgi:hypothetical protein
VEQRARWHDANAGKPRHVRTGAYLRRAFSLLLSFGKTKESKKVILHKDM